MGLDQYAYKTKVKLSKDVDFGEELNKAAETEFPDGAYDEFNYWRKHPNLQGWMQKLYEKKGGQNPDFNCSPVALTQEDIDNLAQDIIDNNLPQTSGFFFGESIRDREQEKHDLEFCKQASEAIKEGYTVFYDSWW